MKPIAAWLLAVLVAASASAQREWWVEPAVGSDSNPGTHASPLRTLSTACVFAGPGDRIHLQAGLYGPSHNGEVLPITVGNTAQQDLVIRGLGGAVFDLAGSASTVFRLVNGADRLRLTNLTFLNSDQSGWWTRVISSGSAVNSGNAARDVEIDRCRFVGCNRAIVLWTADNVQGWRIHDNLFWNCSNDAILEYAGDNSIDNNTFVTGAWKAYISDSATSRCRNNLIVGYNIAFENNNAANNVARYEHNWVHQTTTVGQGVGLAAGLPPTNIVGTDPQFVGAATGDFRLQATSPCLDAGTAAVFARADLDGVSRIVDHDQDGSLRPDIGCHERTPLALTAVFDPATALLTIQTASAWQGMFTFVLFSFDDGLAAVPGQGPILVDPATFIPSWLSGAAPGYWVLNLQGLVLPPGTRLVMHALGLTTAPALVGGNQVWTQL